MSLVFFNAAPAFIDSHTPRASISASATRHLDLASFKGQGGHPVPGGVATLLHLPLHSDRPTPPSKLSTPSTASTSPPSAIT